MLKSSLNIAHFKQYVPIIEKEAKEYFKSWGENGERSKQNALHLSHSFLSIYRTQENVQKGHVSNEKEVLTAMHL